MRQFFQAYRKNGMLVFLILYLVFYTTDAAAGYFMIFLKNIGFNTLQMGVLTAGAALTAMFFQPLMGCIADRSGTKNATLIMALLLAAFACLMLRLSTAFFYILIVYTVYLVARNTLHPLVDSITLEHVVARGLEFGPVRTMGCIGYACMAVVAGRVAGRDPADTFVLYAATVLATLAVVAFLPKSYGRQRGKRINPMLIFANRQLLLYTLFAVVMACTKSYYHNFFSVYYTSELGGSTQLYGVLLSISAFMEIPVIFSIDRLNQRFGIRRVMIAAAIVETVRWLLTASIMNPTVQLIAQAVMGCNNMTLSLSMVMFVDSMMSPETKTTGQATYTMCTSIGSLLVGNLLGGAISNIIGIRSVFFACVLINVFVILAFAAKTKEASAG